MSERFKCPIAIHLFLQKDDKVLLQLRTGSSFADHWGVVAGHLDGGETAISACLREANEEIGIDLDPDSLRLATICHSYAEKIEYMQLFFWCDKWSGEIKNLETDKCKELEWFNLNELPDNIVPYLSKAIEKAKSDSSFYEDGFPCL